MRTGLADEHHDGSMGGIWLAAPQIWPSVMAAATCLKICRGEEEEQHKEQGYHTAPQMMPKVNPSLEEAVELMHSPRDS